MRVGMQTFSLISASVDAKEREDMTELTALSSLRSSLQQTVTGIPEDDQEHVANGTSGQLTCKSSLQTFSVRRSAECMHYEHTGDEEIDSICAGLAAHDSVHSNIARPMRSGQASGGVLGSLSKSTLFNSALTGTHPGTAFSTANGTITQGFETATSPTGTSSHVEGSLPNRVFSPALGAAGDCHANLVQLHTPQKVPEKDSGAPALAQASDEEGEPDDSILIATTPPEGGYVRSLVRNLPWRSPQAQPVDASNSDVIATPNSCPLQTSPCIVGADESGSRSVAGQSAPVAPNPVAPDTTPDDSSEKPASNEAEQLVPTGPCNKVTSWLEEAPSRIKGLPVGVASSLPSSSGIQGVSIPWMPSGTSNLISSAMKYTPEQEQEDRNRCSFESQSNVASPAHCLQAEINITAQCIPPGSSLDTVNRGPIILDSATGQPCTVMKLVSHGSTIEGIGQVTARVIVCTYAQQCAAIEERANVSDVCPPIVPLQVPEGMCEAESTATISGTLRSAPAVCFECTETLADHISEGTTHSSPEDAAVLLASLCALLERLHIAGYTSGGVTPEEVVRPTPITRSGDWKLMCAHSMLQQGSTAEPVAPLSIRWCAPEQLMFAKGTDGSTSNTEVLISMQQAGADGGDNRASPIHTPRLAIADVASDMFSLGLILYKAVTGCDYWGDFTDSQVAEALAGEIAMPHLNNGPANDNPGAEVILPMISPLLTRSAPARPLASETLASVHERFPGILKQVVMRTSIPRSPLDHIRYPDSKPPVRATSNTQAVTMRFMLAQRGPRSEVLQAVTAQRVNHKWVFPVSSQGQYHMVVCIELSDNAPVSVFPMESASHVVAEASNASAPTGGLSQTLEIQSADAYYAGRGVLLLVPWDPFELINDCSIQEMRMHLFTKVVGFSELIKISKRVHINVTDSERSIADDYTEPLQVPLDVVQAAREGGIHFEAHIPLSKQVLEGA